MASTPADRRRYPRIKLSCPVSLTDETGRALLAQTIDLSDGGTLVAAPAEGAPAPGAVMGVEVHVPASASRTGQASRFTCQAKVVRCRDVGQERKIGVALEFLTPQKLDLRE
jgi:c-di-GMP-binding flagellar brake protein YcgR